MSKRGYVLLISNNKVWRKYLGSILKKQGVEYVETNSIEDAVAIPFRYPVDVLILDYTNRQEHINDTCRNLKRDLPFKDTPAVIIILEEQLHQVDTSTEIEDFIIQRDTYDEALLRIKRVLWKKIHSINKEALAIGNLMIDIDNYEASINGKPIYLTFKEFELLKFFLLNRGRVFTRDDLLDKVWGYDNYVGTRTVDIHVQRLRYKLGTPVGDMIVTVRNVGYKFASE